MDVVVRANRARMFQAWQLPASNDTPARSQAYKFLPLIGGHEGVENLVDLVPRL